ncbi:Uncharacterised protein [Legionella sainthelensi]|nr:Uncharacterised protein [Legionella sainthelensi]
MSWHYFLGIGQSSKVTLTNKIELVRLMENSYEFPINVNPEFLK